MKHLWLLILLFALCSCSYAFAESTFRDIPMEEVQAAFNQPIKPHPRLFFTSDQVTQIKAKLKSAFQKGLLSKNVILDLEKKLMKMKKSEGN